MTVDINTLSEAKVRLKTLQEYNVNQLERASELGDLAFTTGKEVALRIQNIALNIDAEELDFLPEDTITHIHNRCHEVLRVFRAMQKFSLDKQHPQVERDRLVQELKVAYQDFYNKMSTHIAYLEAIKKPDLTLKEEIEKVHSLWNVQFKEALSRSNKKARDASNKADKAINEANEVISNAEERLKEADALIESIKNASAEGGALEQAKHFRGEKEYHKKRARWWAFGTLLSAIILLTYTFFSINLHTLYGIDLNGPDKEALAIQVTSTKLLIFAVLGYMLILSVKNFMSHKHNMVVNSHREVALHTFEALAKAANQDEGARDIILTHAASCIFSPQDTGYVKFNSSSDANGLTGSSLILNLMKKSDE